MKCLPYESSSRLFRVRTYQSSQDLWIYHPVRQNGSHITVTTQRNGKHHLAIPNHNPLKIGTLNGIISRVASHLGEDYTKEKVLRELFS